MNYPTTHTISSLTMQSLSCIENCVKLLAFSENAEDIVVTRLESILVAMRTYEGEIRPNWISAREPILEYVIGILIRMADYQANVINDNDRGRPTIQLQISSLEYLLSMRFSAVDIAKLFGVSRDTIFRRLKSHGISVLGSYSAISDADLQEKVSGILSQFPNTGYKRMKGFLQQQGLKLTDQRVRETMRIVDPQGVLQRTSENRAIVRRLYFVQYFNELWHLDTNLKLVRWKIVIRSCIDGKTRTVTYLDASSDNRAQTNFASFIKAVSEYGIPSRTRSDKGRENVFIARFMIERRGTGRGSHICGRSVHNQRIERFWRDVFYGCTSLFHNLFSFLEENGLLNPDNPKHLYILHLIFLPIINNCMQIFMQAWNNHPISSEHNYSPRQLMMLHLPPPHYDLSLNQIDLEDVYFLCHQEDDLLLLEDETITNPVLEYNCLSEHEVFRLQQIDVTRESNCYGYDIYLDALSCLEN